MAAYRDERGRDMYSCDHQGCKKFAQPEAAAKLGWDWFTGYLPRTHHYCRKHSESEERDLMLVQSRRAPEVSR